MVAGIETIVMEFQPISKRIPFIRFILKTVKHFYKYKY